MDLRLRTSLFCGVLALAIAVSLILRKRPRRATFYCAAFAADIGLWYLAQWLYHVVHAEVWARVTAVLAVLLPQFALRLFEAIIPEPQRRSTLLSVAGALMLPMLILVLSPLQGQKWVRVTVFTYVFGLLLAGLWSLAFRGNRTRSRATQRRIRFLVLIGALAAAFSLSDFLWFIGAPLPPVGAVLSIVFLFVLGESMVRQRLLDLYEILGQLMVSTALAFALAGIFYVFVVLIGGFEEMYLAAILAAVVILLLFEPLREKVETYINAAFFRERVELERAVTMARAELATTLQVDEMSQTVLLALETSGRATGAVLYLRDPNSEVFEIAQSFGPDPPPRIDSAAFRPLIERLGSTKSLQLEQIAFAVSEARGTAWARLAESDERLLVACEPLGVYKGALCVSIYGEGSGLIGILMLIDDRISDAFTEDDVIVLEALAVHIGVVVENSRQYLRMQERDRLAVLGQLAAGLAHEVKNPLGAIKGAAQLLSEPSDGTALDPGAQEFVSIILEEVERLDRVVGSVLDYARPSGGQLGLVDLNAVVRRTIQVLASDREDECELRMVLAEGLPQVRANAEQLRQVLINLVRNAIQAMGGTGKIEVLTRLRSHGRARREVGGGVSATAASEHSPAPRTSWVEVAVRDEGPGILPQVQRSLFQPFFTTKHKGTGLGLAICQRMVEEMGGRIDVYSRPGHGATFTVALPAAADVPSRGTKVHPSPRASDPSVEPREAVIEDLMRQPPVPAGPLPELCLLDEGGKRRGKRIDEHPRGSRPMIGSRPISRVSSTCPVLDPFSAPALSFDSTCLSVCRPGVPWVRLLAR